MCVVAGSAGPVENPGDSDGLEEEGQLCSRLGERRSPFPSGSFCTGPAVRNCWQARRTASLWSSGVKPRVLSFSEICSIIPSGNLVVNLIVSLSVTVQLLRLSVTVQTFCDRLSQLLTKL